MHHKRGKPKSARAGCLMCKPHKHQRTGELANPKRRHLVEKVRREEAKKDV